MITPIWIIPPLALFVAYHHFMAYLRSEPLNPSRFMWLAKSIVETFFATIYVWWLLDPGLSALRADIVRFMILILFGTNALAILIEKYILYNFIQRMIRGLKNFAARINDAH